MGAEQQQQQQAAGGSRFAAAFGLLRQYMREQPGAGGGGMVTVGLMPGGGVDGVDAVTPEQRIRTMELFPQQAGTVRGSHERSDDQGRGPAESLGRSRGRKLSRSRPLVISSRLGSTPRSSSTEGFDEPGEE
uniref:Uncharacterized protein n=1 Tax=Aegilops tauschii TaxID=37682 RepID=N1R298_AEGTA